jgi:hypothetical protein
MGSDAVRNVLVLMTDQHRATAGGRMGDPWARTPHLGALLAASTPAP